MEPVKDSISVSIVEETHIAEARRTAAELCRNLGLADPTIARAELIAVELASNILHHAQRGNVYLGPTAEGRGLQMIATDSGPGLLDVERALKDGFSTRTTPGTGLGAARRKSDGFDVFSRRDAGTVVLALVRDTPASASPDELAHAAVLSTRIDGERVNGDSWALYRLPGRQVYLMVDGLGHGHHAAIASAMAISIVDIALEQDPAMPLAAILKRMDTPMRATRGAAVMLLSVADTKVVCCGVGNISAVLCARNGTTRSLVSHNGTVGHRMARVQEFEYPAEPGSLLVAHSDGISTRWKLANHIGIFDHAQGTIAGVIYREAVRGRDDATVLVARLGATQPAGAKPQDAQPAGPQSGGAA